MTRPHQNAASGRGLFSQAERDVALAFTALRIGRPLARPLTGPERLVVGVTLARPLYFLTLDSPDLTRAEIAREWAKLTKRIERSRPTRRPLVYFSCFAQGGNGGYHAHVLLWDFLHIGMLRGHLRKLDFGHPNVERLPPPNVEIRPPTAEEHVREEQDLVRVVGAVSYVVGQYQPVFGSRHHARHVPRERNKRRFVYPLPSTLARWRPELLAALTAAKDRSVQDVQLARRLPRFSKRERVDPSSPKSKALGA